MRTSHAVFIRRYELEHPKAAEPSSGEVAGKSQELIPDSSDATLEASARASEKAPLDWHHTETLAYIPWQTGDSLSRCVIDEWQAERARRFELATDETRDDMLGGDRNRHSSPRG